MNYKKGFSIPEVFVAMAVMGVMFTMLLAIVVILNKNYREYEKKSAMEQNAATVLSKLTRELMETSYNTVTVYNNYANYPDGIIFASPRDSSNYNKFDIDSSGTCRWHKYICYYIAQDPGEPENKALFRKEKERTDGLFTETTTSLTTSDFKYDSVPAVIVSHKIGDLNFPDLGIGRFQPLQIYSVMPMKISITLNDAITSDSVTVTFTVNMNN